MAALIDQQSGESAMRWAVRIAVLFYLLRLWLVLRGGSRIPNQGECWLWTCGWVSCAVHVILAFHFVHEWSHTEAWQHTANETERMIGIRRGEGLWVNYAFTMLWFADVVRLWSAHLRDRATDRGLNLFSHTFFAFIVFNATVVFGPAVYRWLAIPVAIWLSRAWYLGRQDSRRDLDDVRQ